MKKLITLIAVGAIAFGVVSAAAASLGASSNSKTLSATRTSVSGCGTNLGIVTVTYTTDYSTGENAYVVKDVILTSASDGTNDISTTTFSGCQSGTASVTLNDGTVKQAPSMTLTSPTVLTLALPTWIKVNDVSNFAVVIQGA